jgi:hypothetical protein
MFVRGIPVCLLGVYRYVDLVSVSYDLSIRFRDYSDYEVLAFFQFTVLQTSTSFII